MSEIARFGIITGVFTGNDNIPNFSTQKRIVWYSKIATKQPLRQCVVVAGAIAIATIFEFNQKSL